MNFNTNSNLVNEAQIKKENKYNISKCGHFNYVYVH